MLTIQFILKQLLNGNPEITFLNKLKYPPNITFNGWDYVATIPKEKVSYVKTRDLFTSKFLFIYTYKISFFLIWFNDFSSQEDFIDFLVFKYFTDDFFLNPEYSNKIKLQ